MTNFSFVGTIRPMKDGFVSQDFDSGWMIERCKFIVLAGENSHIVEINAGRWKEESKNVIYTMSRGNGDKKSAKMQVAWKDRKDPKVIDKVAGFRIMTVDLDTYDNHQKARESGDDEIIAASNKKIHHFIAGTDFCEFVNKLTNNEKIKDMRFRVNGTVTYTYNAKDDRYYSNYEVTKIYRVDNEVENSSAMTIPFYFGRECIDESAFEDHGFITLSGYTDFYDNSEKATYFCPLNLVLRVSEKALPRWKSKFNCFTNDDEDDAIKKISLDCEKIHGSPMVNITLEDLDDDTKEDIEFGLTTLEDVIREMGQVKGDRIEEIRVVRLGIGSRKSPAEDTDYTLSDMNLRPGMKSDEADDEDEVKETKKSKSSKSTAKRKPVHEEIEDDDDDDLFGDVDDDDDDDLDI